LLAAALAVLGCALLAGTAPASQARQVVVLDPGHDLRGNPDTEPIGPGSAERKIKDGGGTRGVVTGIAEADLTLDLSRRLRVLLERAGIRVILTRTRTAGTSIGNIARARIANDAGAALFLRIHADGHSDRSARGTHALVPSYRRGWTDDVYAPSRRAARALLAELVPVLGFPDRGIREVSNFTGLNWADVPVVLVEVGFMTNPTEDRALATGPVREATALGLCRGTLRFLGRPRARCG
jgi:N-acetylmuramoyl-L-alanine amidase